MSPTTLSTPSRRVRSLARRVAAGTLGAALTFSVVACSDDSDDSADGGDGSAGASGEPISITDQFGTTEVPDNPEKVVVGNPAWRDALVALDVPFELSVHTAAIEGNPWEGSTDAEEVAYSDASDYPVEKVAAVDPDVILGAPSTEEDLHGKLSEIAPTVGTIGESVDDWREVLSLAGEIFDKEDEAAALEQDFDDKVTAFREDNPGIEGKTFTFTALIQDQMWAVANPEDPLNIFFSDLGMEINPEVVELDDGQTSGRVRVAQENLKVLDTDAIIHQGEDTVGDAISGWSDLSAVENGTVLYLYPNPLQQPSVLSVTWALDHMTPELEKTAEL